MVDMPGCEYEEFIKAPDYCSGCDAFHEVEISNIRCNETDPTKWDFDILVHGPTLPPGQTYTIESDNKTFNTTHTIHEGLLTDGCQKSELIYDGCISYIIVCPPKPCDKECGLEVYIEDIDCYYSDKEVYYWVTLDVGGAGMNQHYCYSVNGGTGSSLNYNPYTGSYLIGFFTTDITLNVYLCDNGVNCNQGCDDCFKTLYIPKPDCITQKEIENGGKGEGGKGRNRRKENGNTSIDLGELIVIPNPFSSDEIILRSNLETTNFKIFDTSGQLIQKGDFKGDEHRISLNISQGLYFIRYTNSIGKPAFVKMIKL